MAVFEYFEVFGLQIRDLFAVFSNDDIDLHEVGRDADDVLRLLRHSL